MDPRCLQLLACPHCRAPLRQAADNLVCIQCAESFAIEGDIPRLRGALDAKTLAVRGFYEEAPFPNYPPGSDDLGALRARAGRSELAQLLDAALPGDACILDLGCGTGQMGIFLASADRVVIGADMTAPSLQLAAAAARRYRVENALFIETDLRAPGLREGAFDAVFCSGVLHHTPNPRQSFKAVASLVRPGGVLLLGLYNAFARLPHRLRRGLVSLIGSPALKLDPVLRERSLEPERRRAWIRDQYEHPEEHRHTVAEVRAWFAENELHWLRTIPSSAVGEEPITSRELFTSAGDHWAAESLLAQLAWANSLGHEGGLFIAIGGKKLGTN